MSEHDGPRLRIVVTYSESDESFEEWVPTTASKITSDGIADPGFGSGPVAYSEIERVFVYAEPKNSITPAEYARKFQLLRELTAELPHVRTHPDGLSFSRSE
jgi:hypothetical protein